MCVHRLALRRLSEVKEPSYNSTDTQDLLRMRDLMCSKTQCGWNATNSHMARIEAGQNFAIALSHQVQRPAIAYWTATVNLIQMSAALVLVPIRDNIPFSRVCALDDGYHVRTIIVS